MKKLYRSRDNKIIAGVAGGVAEYFDVDPVLVRLLFVALLFSGAIVVAYIMAWIMVPLAPESKK